MGAIVTQKDSSNKLNYYQIATEKDSSHKLKLIKLPLKQTIAIY